MMVETRGKYWTAQEYIQMLKGAGISDMGVVRSSGDKYMVVGQV
jgi:hypothetical protein